MILLGYLWGWASKKTDSNHSKHPGNHTTHQKHTATQLQYAIAKPDFLFFIFSQNLPKFLYSP